MRDRMIMTAAAAPAVLGVGVALLFTQDLVVVGAVGASLALVSAALSLTPPVTAARIRHLRRRCPKED
ncbi:hypothetical protein [Brevundimonas naejangsanensis]|nr:hypothetical protein [Brevundimonas naejangsanensis]QBQ48843.1 hypothetical protein E3U41_09225 [Brevundimonas naejangsanensis]